MDPYHPFHRQFQARKETRSRLGWWALAAATGALGLGQWLGVEAIEESEPFRPVAEAKAKPRASLTLNERAGRELRGERAPGSSGAPLEPKLEQEGGDTAAPAMPLPPMGAEHLSAEYFDTALQGLANQGADMSQPMPSRHLVATRSLVAAQRMVLWGRQQGYHVEPMRTPSQGEGEPIYLVPLVKVLVPRAASILADAQRIAAFAATQEGLAYQGWEGAVVRRP
jgi:Regulator of ribonuclease activity B